MRRTVVEKEFVMNKDGAASKCSTTAASPLSARLHCPRKMLYHRGHRGYHDHQRTLSPPWPLIIVGRRKHQSSRSAWPRPLSYSTRGCGMLQSQPSVLLLRFCLFAMMPWLERKHVSYLSPILMAEGSCITLRLRTLLVPILQHLRFFTEGRGG